MYTTRVRSRRMPANVQLPRSPPCPLVPAWDPPFRNMYFRENRRNRFRSEEFQPKENLSIFGSNEKPEQDEEDDVGEGGVGDRWHGVVDDAVRNEGQNKRMTAFFNIFTAKSSANVTEGVLEGEIDKNRSFFETDSDDDGSLTGLMARRARSRSRTPPRAGSRRAAVSPPALPPRDQAAPAPLVHLSPPALPPRHPGAERDPDSEEDELDLAINANRAVLEADEEYSPRRATMAAEAFRAPSPVASVVFASRRDAANGGKLKAAVLRAMDATKRERQMSFKRGRGKERERLSNEAEAALRSTECTEFIQVKHPVMNTVCLEYGLTEGVAEAKYR